MNEKLELKDLVPYLASGLLTDKGELWAMCRDNLVKARIEKIGIVKYTLEEIKPIFRPLADLTLPCLEGGKIPIVELAKMAYSDTYGYASIETVEILSFDGGYGFIGTDDDTDRVGFSYETDMNKNEFYFSVNHQKLRVNQLQLFQQLYSWHFWLGDQYYFEKGIIIDINTIK